MKRLLALGATIAGVLAVPLSGVAAAPGAVVCSQDTQAFSGSASTLIVPADGYCEITNASIAADLVLQDGAGADLGNVRIGGSMTGGVDAGAGISDTTIGRDLSLQGGDGGAELAGVTIGHDYRLSDGAGTSMERTAIGHDFVATQSSSIQTGKVGRDGLGGPVSVGHDALITGFFADNPFVFDGICNLHVGHDMRVTNRTVTLGFGIASVACPREGQPGNTIDHDLVVTGNTAAVGFFGPSSLRIADDRVGHDLIFSGNAAAAGGSLEVTGNTVGHDAICSGNAPALTVVTPNVAGHKNTCG